MTMIRAKLSWLYYQELSVKAKYNMKQMERINT